MSRTLFCCEPNDQMGNSVGGHSVFQRLLMEDDARREIDINKLWCRVTNSILDTAGDLQIRSFTQDSNDLLMVKPWSKPSESLIKDVWGFLLMYLVPHYPTISKRDAKGYVFSLMGTENATSIQIPKKSCLNNVSVVTITGDIPLPVN